MGALISNEDFQHDFYDRTHGEFIFLETYGGSKEPRLCLHTVCNNTFRVSPDNLKKRKYPCPYCKDNNFTFQIINGHVDHLVTVRCRYKHRFKVMQSEIPKFKTGKLTCPICEKLAYWDPIYQNAPVEFFFGSGGDCLL